MADFIFYFRQGINHITDFNGFDHMVFIVTLCAVYNIKQLKQLLILVTSFTIGHTLTLALSALQIITINQQLIETLIPITILLTSIYNITSWKVSKRVYNYNYFLAIGFGLIHGMGFSNFFRAMMMGITDNSIIFPLFSFNVGIEFGQIIIVSIFFSILFLATKFFSVNHRDWRFYISGAGGGIALTMILKVILDT